MYDYLLSEDNKKFREEVREFVKTEVPPSLLRKMDNDEVQYPGEFVQALAKQNLIGIRFLKEYGGRGLNWEAEIIAEEEIGVLGSSLACLFSITSICGEAFHHFGSEDQKQRYLIPLCEGKKFCAEALTEPRGGSDFFGATCTAVKEGDHYILNGEKRFVVGAEGADFFLVYAKTNPNAPPHESLSLFVVDRSDAVESAYIYGLMGTRGGGAGRLVFKDCEVPKENIILGEGAGGKIFYQMMVPERLTTASGLIGLARACHRISTKYSTKRKAFGQTINRFQAVNFMVAENCTLLDASRAIVYNTARSIDSGAPPALQRRLVSESKKFSTEACWKVINNAMQIVAGIGYTTVYPIERLMRDCRIGMIWTGTKQIGKPICV